MPIFLINTLLLYIPLLALTDRRNYGGTNTLAARGLEEHWGGYVFTIHFEMKLDVFRFWWVYLFIVHYLWWGKASFFFFIEGSCNRPYLCGDFLLLLCQMFMTLFSLGFRESCFFLWGKQLVLFFVFGSIFFLYLISLIGSERLTMFF